MIIIQYLGGKSRISKQISEVINNEVSRWKIKNSETDSGNNRERERESNLTFVSLFCGSCSIESKIKGFDKVICNDKHYYLIEKKTLTVFYPQSFQLKLYRNQDFYF
jgi:DNA adenine methylase